MAKRKEHSLQQARPDDTMITTTTEAEHDFLSRSDTQTKEF